MKQHREEQGQWKSEAESITHFPTAHVVLYQPEIPPNTGNIGRSCVAVGAKLWIVRPIGFSLDDKQVRRAGMDYWQHVDLEDVPNWTEVTSRLAPRRFFYFSKHATRTIWDAEFARDDVFVFGSESSGLPENILNPDDTQSLRIPMREQVRSLNLAVTVGIVLYEHQRQLIQRESER